MADQIRIKIGLDGVPQVQAGANAAAASLDKVGKSAEGISKAGGAGIDGIATALRSLGAIGVVSIGAGLAREFVQAADAVTVLRNQLQLATGSVGAASAAYESLYGIAQRSRVSFTELGGTFASIARATDGMGVSQQRLLTVTEAIGNAMAISGGSAASMQAALVQLSQGFASGTLRGEELNSVMEQTPRLARAIADGLGVSIGKLREMGKAGELTAEAVLKALESQSAVLAGEVQGSVVTVGQALTQLGNTSTRAIGELNQTLGATSALAAGLQSLSNTVDDVADRFRRAREAGNGFMGSVVAAQVMAFAEALGYVDENAANIPRRLAEAEKELSTLQQRLAAKGGQYLALETEKARELVAELKRAKQAQDDLKAQRSTSQSQQFGEASGTISAIAAKGLEQQRLAQEALAGVRNKALGVDKAYTDQLQKLYGFLRDGHLTTSEYTEAVQKLTAATFKQTGAAKAARDAERELEKQRSVINGLLGVTDDYTESLERLQVMRRAGLLDEANYVKAVEMLIARQPSAIQQTKERAEVERALARISAQAANAELQQIEALERQAGTLHEQIQALYLSEEALTAQAVATMRATAADLEWQAGNEGGNALLSERARLLRVVADRTEALAGGRAAAKERERADQYAKTVAEADERARQEIEQGWDSTADTITGLLTNAIRLGGEEGWDYVEDYIKANALQAVVRMGVDWAGAALGIAGAGGAGGGGGGLSWLSVLGGARNAYGTAAGWLGGGSAAAGAGALSGSAYGAAVNAALAEYGIVEGGAAAAGASGAASAIPIIGWIIAGIMASKSAYAGGNNLSMLSDARSDYGIGQWEALNKRMFEDIGISEKWAEILSGAPLTARLFGHKASASGFGFGTVAGGDFLQSATSPLAFGANTLGVSGPSEGLQGLASDIAAAVALAAGQFGGRLQDGLRVGAFTDRDRDNEVAALLGYFGADNKLIAGAQTGSGAFGAGGPGGAAGKIKAEDLQKWIGEQMPLLIIQGLQQSDLSQRFEDYFSSIATDKLTPEAANNILQTAAAVQQVADAFGPIGGVFAQLETASVDSVVATAKAVGGFDALTSASSAYYRAFYSEAERTSVATEQVTKTLADLGLTMPDLGAGADKVRQQFRAIVDATEINTEGGRERLATLLQIAPILDQLATAADAAARRINDTRASLQLELLRAQGDAQAALTLQRQQELDALRQLDPALASMKEAIYAATDAAAAAARQQRLQGGIDSVVGDFLGGAELQAYLAQRILDIVGEGGITGDIAGVLGSTKESLLALFRAVGIDGQEAILEALPLWEQLQEVIHGTSNAIKAYRDGALGDAISEAGFASLKPADRIRELRNSAEYLQDQIATGDDPVGSAQRLQRVYEWIFEAEAELNADRLESLADQLETAKQLKNYVADLRQFTGSLGSSNLSPYSSAQQVGSAGSLFQRTLAGARAGNTADIRNLQANAQNYLSVAQRTYGTGSAAYGGIFEKVDTALTEFADRIEASDDVSVLQQQYNELKSISDYSGQMLAALLLIDKALRNRHLGGDTSSAGSDRFVGGAAGTEGDGVVRIADVGPSIAEQRSDIALLERASAVSELRAMRAEMTSSIDRLRELIAVERESARLTDEGLDQVREVLEDIRGQVTRGEVPA